MRILKMNCYFEAMKLVLSIVKKESFTQTAQKLYEEFDHDPNIMKAFSAGIEAEKMLSDIPFDKANLLFHNIEDGEDVYADILILCYATIEKDISPKSYLLEEFRKDQGKKFLSSLLKTNLTHIDHITMLIIHSDLSDKTKLECIEVMENIDSFLIEFCDIVEEVKQRIEPILKKYEKLYENMEKFISEHTVDKIFERFHISVNEKKNDDISILPMMLCCNEVSFIDDLHLMAGVLFAFVDVQQQRVYSIHELADSVRTLGDQMNIMILKYLKEGPLYQTQLANYLNVSKPVINYHIQQMVRYDLIRIDIKGKKVYIKKDEDKLHDLFQKYMSFINNE